MPTRSQRPRLPEVSEGQRKAKLAWNGGMTGESQKPTVSPAVEVCTIEACGTPVVSGQAPVDVMVEVRGSLDGAQSHWFCRGRCAAIAQARAELRAIPMLPGGEGR